MDPQHGQGLTFSEALEQLKDGRKVTRARWTDAEGRDQWIVRQDGYPQGIPLNRNTAQATGLPEGSEQKFAPYYMLYTIYSTFVPWTPGHGDLNADDWAIYYMPGEYERLCQEETDAILADPETAADLEEAGLDLATYSHEEVKMVVALRALERDDFPDREAVRFRLLNQLFRPVLDNQRQLDLADPPLPLDSLTPQVALLSRTFVNILTKINDELTQAKLVLDSTREKLDTLDEFNQSWLGKYPVPDGLNSNDAVLAHHRIRYYQEGWANSPGFTQTTWRLISTLLAPMLEEWRQSHADTTGDFDLDRFKVTFHGARNDGVDTIRHMEMELMSPITPEQVAVMEKALGALGDPEATQQLVRLGNIGDPEHRQRLTDRFPLLGVSTPRQIRRAAPDAEPTQVVKYFLNQMYLDPQEEVTEAEYQRAAQEAEGWVPGRPLPEVISDGDVQGHIEYYPQ